MPAEPLLRLVYARGDWDFLLDADRVALFVPAKDVRIHWHLARTTVTSEPLPAESPRMEALARVARALFAELMVEAAVVDADVRQCRTCGCLEHLACEGGCAWVAADLCSACVAADEGVTRG